MRIAIIDDERHCIESLKMNIQKADPSSEIVFEEKKVEKALQLVKEHEIDLLFLDVEMPVLTGFEFLDQLHNINFKVIFTTAHSQYAHRAFKYQAFDYLLKPIKVVDLAEVFEKINNQQNSQEIEKLIMALKKDNVIESKIAVPVSEGLEFIRVDEIVYAQSQNNYTLLYLQNDEKLLFSKTLKEVERTLKKHLFIRIHQSFLINPNYMRKYYRNDGGSILMDNGTTLPISQKKKEEIMTLFDAISKSKSL